MIYKFFRNKLNLRKKNLNKTCRKKERLDYNTLNTKNKKRRLYHQMQYNLTT